jgi:small subunit ribosomal protein S6
MVILRPSMTEEDRDRELAKFEAFLAREECLNINGLVRPNTKLAYSMKSWVAQQRRAQ